MAVGADWRGTGAVSDASKKILRDSGMSEGDGVSIYIYIARPRLTCYYITSMYLNISNVFILKAHANDPHIWGHIAGLLN